MAGPIGRFRYRDTGISRRRLTRRKPSGSPKEAICNTPNRCANHPLTNLLRTCTKLSYIQPISIACRGLSMTAGCLGPVSHLSCQSPRGSMPGASKKPKKVWS